LPTTFFIQYENCRSQESRIYDNFDGNWSNRRMDDFLHNDFFLLV